MFNIEELNFLQNVLQETESQDEMTLSLIEKIKDVTKQASECKEYLWSFYWDCGRQGEVEGLFKATEKEVKNAIGKEVYFGEILGKHSEVYGTIENGEITLESDDPLVVLNAKESGYNPLNYLQYKCPVCGNSYREDEFDIEANICCYCKEERKQN